MTFPAWAQGPPRPTSRLKSGAVAAGPVRDEAASPLVVIITFVLVAIGITTLLFFLVVDTAGPDVEVQAVEGGFEVTQVTGSIAWSDLDVRFLDRAGRDQADTYLDLPTGKVREGERIDLRAQPPQGTFVLVVALEDEELARVRADL